MTAGPGGVICAGNWIVDIIHTIDAWPEKSTLATIRGEAVALGGGAANVALDLRAMAPGLPVHPVGLIGADAHGSLLRESCAAAGLPIGFLTVTDAAPTAHTHVMNVPGDSRTFFFQPGTNELIAEEHVPVGALAKTGARLFYLSYINLIGRLDHIGPDGRTGAARLLAQARAAGLMTCADLVSVRSDLFARTLGAALPELDYLFLNEVEAARATGQDDIAAEDSEALARAAETLRRGGAGAVVVHTPSLALWAGPEGVEVIPAEPVPAEMIVSPVGAGDAFCAGALYGIHEGWAVRDCLTLGHRAAVACLGGASSTEGLRPLSELMPDHRPGTGER